MDNVKLADIVNLEVTFEKGGYDNYKTNYDKSLGSNEEECKKLNSEKFRVGRRVDFRVDDHEAKGNFEICRPIKGTKKDDWDWTVVEYDRKKFTQSYSYLVETGDKEGYVELSWSANKALIEVVGVDEYGKADLPATVKLKRPDKAYEFTKVTDVKKETPVENADEADDGLPF